MRKLFVCVVSTISWTAVKSADLDKKIEGILPVATQNMLANISRPDTQPGFVVASPSKANPDYYFHWTRDAALTMGTVIDAMKHETDAVKHAKMSRLLLDYVEFSRRNQQTQTLSFGFGEPKFNIDGSGFAEPWGRPQSDGAALRALTVIRFARLMLQDPRNDQYVRGVLYDGNYPTSSVIKADLEYVAHHWRDPSFDLWEEVNGDHFYTHMAHRAALLEGAKLAQDLGDHGAAAFYRAQVTNLNAQILSYWDQHQKFFRTTLNFKGGVDYKYSNVDAAVILGLLHGHTNDGFLDFDDEKVLATVAHIEKSFKYIYDINYNGLAAPAIGRYPEDRYDGYKTMTIGNPWFITTFALAEFHYRLASLLEAKGLSSVASRERGDAYMARALYHINQNDFSMSEQFNRYTGHMQGAHDLTWSYASFLTAAFAR